MSTSQRRENEFSSNTMDTKECKKGTHLTDMILLFMVYHGRNESVHDL